MLTSDKRKSPPATDGRVRRSERSRAAIVQALFELIGEGVLAPTADEVADRASIGIRTVFRHFKDMDTLYEALDVLLYERFEPAFLAPVPEGPIEERIEEFVARRAKGYEGIAPYKRAEQRPSSLVPRAEAHGRAYDARPRARDVVRGLGSTPRRSTSR
jgi:AcrR family transcriptional regulator